MTESQISHDDILSPHEGSQKQQKQKTKTPKLFSKILVLCLLVLIFVIFIGVLWERYLEPKFKFENVGGGSQSTAEAFSLEPIIKETPLSTFEGEHPPAEPESSTKNPLMTELLETLRAHLALEKNEAGEINISALQQSIDQLRKGEFAVKSAQILSAVEKGILSLEEFKGFIARHPEGASEHLKTMMLSLENVFSFEDLYVAAKTIPDSVSSEGDAHRFFDKVKHWVKSLVKVEKGNNTPSSVYEEFLKALETQDVERCLAVYEKLSPEFQKNTKDIYHQLQFKEALRQEQRQLFLNLIAGEN
ncbi:hypothetical protein Bealeia1_00207 [Candidatus Bealeia paramacronuclearis]|uniref:Uncharacterized protein n=1 Tax=Candidatus Bealeia paramacronuclearis TaxID=1921001 RepID=A0ABZ2C188_9PROT|nr:hypothetical protein [Candidatus Bealeia paramacronuclearis]